MRPAQFDLEESDDAGVSSSSAGEAAARLASRGVGDLYLWGDATSVADAHHLFCELLRARWAVEEKDSGAFAADLRQKVGNATWAALRPHERLPFKSFKACQRTGRCLRVHAMRLFGVARFRGVAAVLDAANALAPTAGARVAHVYKTKFLFLQKPLICHSQNNQSFGGRGGHLFRFDYKN